MHKHAHNHGVAELKHVRSIYVIGIVLNAVFVVLEFGFGFYTNSLALMSDAGHNLSDVATLALSLFAFSLAGKKANSRFTYGYHKGTILASLTNAVLLLIAVGSIGWEAIQRFMVPEATNGLTISLVAGAGILINAASALLFYRDRKKDLNLRGTYLHLATDALVSAGVVVAGIVISYTGFTWIDPLISLLIMTVVIYSTWGLLTESLNLSMDAVPAGIDIEELKKEMLEDSNLVSVGHIHVWAMGTTRNAMTAHLVFKEGLSAAEIRNIKKELRHRLGHLNVHHVTFETD